VLWVLSIALTFVGARQVAASTIIGLHLHRRLAVVMVGEGVVNLVLSVLLVGPLGLLGVAVGTVLPSLAVSVGFVPWYLREHLGIRMVDFARAVWVRPIIAMLPFAIVTALLEHYWVASNLAVFFAQVAAALPVAALGAVAYGLSRDDRLELRRRFGRFLPRSVVALLHHD
jgi:O-antigen/teichoic acid export membrane protein